jgi:hypothetical protein
MLEFLFAALFGRAAKKRPWLPLSSQLPTDDEVCAAIKSVPTHFTLPSVILGWESKIAITVAGTPVSFGVRSGRLNFTSDLQECGDTNTGIAKQNKPGRTEASLSCDFYERYDVPTIPPAFFNLAPTSEIAIAVYPTGTGPTYPGWIQKAPWIIPSFIVASYDISFDIDGKLQGSISGKSNGFITLPTN